MFFLSNSEVKCSGHGVPVSSIEHQVGNMGIMAQINTLVRTIKQFKETLPTFHTARGKSCCATRLAPFVLFRAPVVLVVNTKVAKFQLERNIYPRHEHADIVHAFPGLGHVGEISIIWAAGNKGWSGCFRDPG